MRKNNRYKIVHQWQFHEESYRNLIFLALVVSKENREEETKTKKNTLVINDNLEKFIGDLTSKIYGTFSQTIMNNLNEKKDENKNWNKTEKQANNKKKTMSLMQNFR